MSAQTSPEEIEDLVTLAAHQGVPVSRTTLVDLRSRVGHEQACARIARAGSLMDAAAALGMELDYVGASRRLGQAGQDVDLATERLRGVANRRELAAFADRHGVAVDPDDLRTYGCSAKDDPHAWIRAVGRVLDAASALGLDIEPRSAWAYVANGDGDAEAAIAKLRRQAAARRRRSSHYCLVSGRGRTWSRRDRTNALARCACDRCEERLRIELDTYTRWILRFEAPLPMRSEQDLEQESWLALNRSLASWERLGDFTPYYGTILSNHMAALNRWFRTEGRGGQQPLSLDADAFTAGDGRRVELIETVPDRTMDTAKIVELRETIEEFLAARGDAASQACVAFEARRLLA